MAALARLAFLVLFLSISGCGIALFADFLYRTGLYGLKYGLLILHAILFSLVAFVFCNSLFGFLCLRLRRSKPNAQLGSGNGQQRPLPPTAVVFPIYNEDVARIMAGVEATYLSLRRTGMESSFEFFVLSDSTDPDHWIEEEVAYFRVLHRLQAVGRLHYRRRVQNKGMKAGNLEDFLERWGGHYEYMIVFDADSLMSGEAMVEMVRRMEARPQVGILQTHPAIIRSQTLYARMQQFANRLYGRVFAAGMETWQRGGGNYIGHNAIIRVEPFMKNCRLPRLPWREPLGGQILSHDFVEAALIRKAGYEVRGAFDIEGSYEEGPVNLLESAKRNRRWCQGNLQHAWLLFSPTLPLLNRLHFLLGILAYTSSLLWFFFLLLSTLVVVQFKRSSLSLIPGGGFITSLNLPLAAQGALIFCATFFMLLSPPIFSYLDLCLNKTRRRLFGGAWPTLSGVALETILSIFLAPLFMLWHAVFVIIIPWGKGISWTSQSRDQERRLSWGDAARTHGWQTAIGLAWMTVAFIYSKTFLLWMSPILIPLIFSIPLNVLYSSAPVGRKLRRWGILLTPEEHQTPLEMADLAHAEQRLTAVLAQIPGPASIFALVDPYINALHVTLQRQFGGDCGARRSDVDKEWMRDFLKKSPAEIGREGFRAMLANAENCRHLHLELWRSPDSEIASEWASAVASYSPAHSSNPLTDDVAARNCY